MADRAGFEAFYRERRDRVARACLLVTLDPSAAEDVTAESFARLWARWDAIEDDDHAGGYVFKTAMRLCAKRRVRAAREVVREAPERPAAQSEERLVDRLAIVEALRALPLRQRQAVVLRDWAGFETQEVARMCAIRESTVRVHLVRGRAALRAALRLEEADR